MIHYQYQQIHIHVDSCIIQEKIFDNFTNHRQQLIDWIEFQ